MFCSGKCFGLLCIGHENKTAKNAISWRWMENVLKCVENNVVCIFLWFKECAINVNIVYDFST